jgi:aryl-alcohol dehydrogenase-like predicted oxidoreductase
MGCKKDEMGRRDFLRSVTAAGLGSAFASATGGAAEQASGPKPPAELAKRVLGKTGVEIPVLGLGTMFNVVENQLMLHRCIDWGVTHWDTASVYGGGNSELGIGLFLERNPDARKDLFIATKASLFGQPRTVDWVEKRLHQSLERMKTSCIDLYYGVHDLNDPAELTPELKKWAEDAKKRNLIKYFGFSTHKNMAECLMAASKLDWIDAVITTYNFRVMQDKKLQEAIDACHKAGIGLVAMKVQGQGSAKKIETDEDKRLTDHFIKRGFTPGQAKVKVVLEDERITSLAMGRGNVSHMALNVAAALDKTSLSRSDRDVLKRYALATCGGYCAGCAAICGGAVPEMPYVSDVMRYLMYYNGCGEHAEARELFADLPEDARSRLAGADYTAAEALCPQGMPIGQLMAEAARKLA